MEMELGIEEFVGSSNIDATQIVIKGKRTRRQRQLSPCGVATITYSSSSASEDHVSGGVGGGSGGGDAHKEAEDLGGRTEKGGSRKFAEMGTAGAAGKVGFYVYECKTCNRTFPSFQALGGHRASHKKPKAAVEERKSPAVPLPPPSSLPQRINDELEEAGRNQIKSTQISLQLGSNGALNSNKAKIHECSICGSEFTSGQALGGHMRRHRASTGGGSQGVGMGGGAIESSCNTATMSTVEPARNILQLDLNLPAPEDDLRESKFQFAATQKSLVMSAPALVDCHY